MTGRSGSAGTTLTVTVALLAPLLAGIAVVVARANESPLESRTSAAAPLIGTVDVAARDHETLVELTVVRAGALAPRTRASGLVTSVDVAVGDTLTTGTVVATVEDLPVVAYTSEAPLFRDLAAGDTGRDVRTAQTFLAELGHYGGAIDGRVTEATEAAIAAFNDAHGWGDDTTLRLASLVWVGPGPGTVATVSSQVDAEVQPGEELVSMTAPISHVTVSEPAGLPPEGDLVLHLGSRTVPYERGSGIVTNPSLASAIADALAPAEQGTVTLALAEPVRIGTVPSSAVVSDPDGATCIFADVTSAPLPVTPLGGRLVVVDLDPGLVGQAVLLNPRDVRTDLTCT